MDREWSWLDEELVGRTALEDSLCGCLRPVIGDIRFRECNEVRISIRHCRRKKLAPGARMSQWHLASARYWLGNGRCGCEFLINSIEWSAGGSLLMSTKALPREMGSSLC